MHAGTPLWKLILKQFDDLLVKVGLLVSSRVGGSLLAPCGVTGTPFDPQSLELSLKHDGRAAFMGGACGPVVCRGHMCLLMHTQDDACSEQELGW